MDTVNKVLHGDCVELLKGFPDDSYDSAVFDPPYGLGTREPSPEEILAYLQGADLTTGDFMGKDWNIPPVAFWRELYRVLKPGAHALFFGGTRTFDLIALGARMVGFERRDTIAEGHPGLMWVYGSGMPKSRNIYRNDVLPLINAQLVEQGIDVAGVEAFEVTIALKGQEFVIRRREGGDLELPEELERLRSQGTGLKPSWEPVMVIRKPLREKTVTENEIRHGTGTMNIDGCRVRHSNAQDFEKHKAGVDAIKARGGSMDNSWKNSSDLSGASDVTSAGRWPPNLHLVHSDGCVRIGSHKVKAITGGTKPHAKKAPISELPNGSFKEKVNRPYTNYAESDGGETVEAWDCEEGCPVKALDAQSGDRPSTLTGKADPTARHGNPGDNHGKSSFGGGNSEVYADSGGASRFFPQFDDDLEPVEVPFLYCAKASNKEATLEGRIENRHPCLHPDEKVLTEVGYRSISSVKLGDRVYAADGCFHAIQAVTRHAYTSSHLFEISAGAHRKTLATDNHPFLIWRPLKKGKSIIGSDVLWLRADQVQRGDYTMTPVLKEVQRAPEDLPCDPEFWFLFGLYVAEGHIQHRDGRDEAYPRFSLNINEEDLVSRIRTYFGFGQTSVYPNGDNGVQVMLFDSNVGRLFWRLGGHGASTKVLSPIIWNLPSNLRDQVFFGWLVGDGGKVRREFQGKTVSADLSAQLQLLGEAAGYRSRFALSRAPPGAGIGERTFKTTKVCHQLNFSEGRRRPNRVLYEGVEYTLRFVTDVRATPYSGDVVNISVSGSPTFQTAVGMSHNTKKPVKYMRYLIRLVTRKGGLTLDPYCGSGSTLHAAILEGVRFTGIELEDASYETARQRVEILLGESSDTTDLIGLMECLDSPIC